MPWLYAVHVPHSWGVPTWVRQRRYPIRDSTFRRTARMGSTALNWDGVGVLRLLRPGHAVAVAQRLLLVE